MLAVPGYNSYICDVDTNTVSLQETKSIPEMKL